jgi:hypothetical protein
MILGAGGALSMSDGSGGAVFGTSTAVTSATVGAGGSSVGCGGAFFQLDVDGQVSSLVASCQDTIPAAQVPYGEVMVVASSETLLIEGCLTQANRSKGVVASLNGALKPGTYTSGVMGYADGTGTVSGGPFEMNISQFGPVGGLIVGSFQLTTFGDAGPLHMVEGKFAVCRLPDNT